MPSRRTVDGQSIILSSHSEDTYIGAASQRDYGRCDDTYESRIDAAFHTGHIGPTKRQCVSSLSCRYLSCQEHGWRRVVTILVALSIVM